MTLLILTRGLPGSGKTTWAKAEIAMLQAHDVPAVRVNRDDLRRELYPDDIGQAFHTHPDRHIREQHITRVQHDRIHALLNAKVSVIVDDTNLQVRRCRELMRIAEETGAKFIEKRFELDPQTCIARQKDRPESEQVPKSVVQRMYDQFFPMAPLPETSGMSSKANKYEGVEPYVRPQLEDVYKRPAFIVDIDGTVAKPNGRGFHEYDKVSTDTPVFEVIQVIRSLFSMGYVILFVSGRKDSCREDTEQWIREHVTVGDELFMRKDGDNRVDWLIKYELFNEHIRDEYDVIGAFDDRNQVLRLWEKMGIQTFKVSGVDGGEF